VNFSTIWEFIAGDSRRAPLGVLVAILTAAALLHLTTARGPMIGAVFVFIILVGLASAVFEEA
jgi:hypothetical protein